MKNNERPQEQTHFIWQEFTSVDGEPPRLMTPWGNPRQHEYPFDFLFDTPVQAVQALRDYGALDEAREHGWVLCMHTLTPLAVEIPET